MTKMNDYSFVLFFFVFLKSFIKSFQNKKIDLPIKKSVRLQVIAYWIRDNKESLNEKSTRQDRYILRSARFDVLPLKVFYLGSKEDKKKIEGDEINGVQQKYEKRSPPVGAQRHALPNRSSQM